MPFTDCDLSLYTIDAMGRVQWCTGNCGGWYSDGLSSLYWYTIKW